MEDEPRLRPAARAVVMDRQHSVLLVHFVFPDVYQPHGLWACPGGGVDPGESLADGITRELREETGLVVDDPGHPVWWKEHVFPMHEWDGQHDTYFLVEVDHFDPEPTMGVHELRAENVDDVRWWTYDELQAGQAAYDDGDSSHPNYAIFSPRQLGHLLSDLIEVGRPDEPIEVSAP